MARPNFYRPVQYVIVNNGPLNRGIARYLSANSWAETWVKLHPLKTAIFTSKAQARKELRLVRKGKRWPADFQIVEVQLCRL